MKSKYPGWKLRNIRRWEAAKGPVLDQVTCKKLLVLIERAEMKVDVMMQNLKR